MTPTEMADWLEADHILVRSRDDRAILHQIAATIRALAAPPAPLEPPAPEWLTLRDAATWASVTRRTLTNWIRDGLIVPSYTLTGSVRVRRADLIGHRPHPPRQTPVTTRAQKDATP